MSHSLTFLHTSPLHTHTFNALLAELAPDLPVEHLVEEDLLRAACEAGEVTPQLRRRIQEILLEAVECGAAVVVCTCSTIGAAAEDVNQRTSVPILRIDRPMAEEAVQLGSRIVVAATLSTTLIPTCRLVEDAARQARKAVQVIPGLYETAWKLFEQGDQAAYLAEIALQLQQSASLGDVIVLAQASMARAADLCPDLPVPVLTSPRSGLLAALQAYHARKIV